MYHISFAFQRAPKRIPASQQQRLSELPKSRLRPFAAIYAGVTVGAMAYMAWRNRQRTKQRLEQRDKLADMALEFANSNETVSELYTPPLRPQLSDETQSFAKLGLMERLSSRSSDWNPARQIEFHRILFSDEFGTAGCLFVYGKLLNNSTSKVPELNDSWKIVRIEICDPRKAPDSDQSGSFQQVWERVSLPARTSNRRIVRLFDYEEDVRDCDSSLGLKDPVCECV